MSIKKKIMALLTAALFVIPSVGLTACGGNNDGANSGDPPSSIVGGDENEGGDESDGQKPTVDTFTGAESKETYDNLENTAKAFFEDELLGKYIGYEEGATLTAEQLASLEIGDKQNVDSVTVIEISYMNTMFGEDEESEGDYGVRASAAEDNTRKHKAYAVKYKDNSFKYFSPLPEVGEALTKSYYLSLVDGAKYTNCTVEVLQEEEDEGEMIPDGGSIEDMISEPIFEREKTIIKIGGNAIERVKISERYDNKDDDNRVLTDRDQTTYYITMRNDTAYSAYITTYEEDGETQEDGYCYRYLNGETDKETWEDVVFDVILGYTGMDMYEEAFTYMDKTETGFKSNDIVFDFIGYDGTPVEKYWNFDVENGRIVKVDMYADWDINKRGNPISQKFYATLSDFGTTEEVTVPNKYSELIDEYIEAHKPIAPQPVISEQEWNEAFDMKAFKNFSLDMSIKTSNGFIGMITKFDYENNLFYESDGSYDTYVAKIDGSYYEYTNYGLNGVGEWNVGELEGVTDQTFELMAAPFWRYFSLFIDRYDDFNSYGGSMMYLEELNVDYDEYTQIHITIEEGKIVGMSFTYRDTELDDPESENYDPNNDYQTVEIRVYDYGKTQIQLPVISE